MSKSGIDPLVTSVTRIQLLRKNERIGKATGFFYINKKDKLFLVTNRHVIANEETQPEALEIRVHSDPRNIRENVDIIIPLYTNSKPVWRDGQRGVDIVAVPLNKDELTSYVFKAFSMENLPPEDIAIDFGGDVLIIGYPLGFYDDIFNLPIIRNATLASVYPVPFRGNPFFLVDARLHPGTSGSPVISKPTNILRGKNGSTKFYDRPMTFLLGILSTAWPFIDSDVARRLGFGPLDLNVVYFSSLIEAITE